MAWSRLTAAIDRNRRVGDGFEAPCRAAGSHSRTRASRCAARGCQRSARGSRIQCERGPGVCRTAQEVSSVPRSASPARAGRRSRSAAFLRISGGAWSTQCCSRGNVLRRRHVRQFAGLSSGSAGLVWNDASAVSSVRSPCATLTCRVAMDRPSRTGSTTMSTGSPNRPSERSTRAGNAAAWASTVADAACMACARSWPPKIRPNRSASLVARNRLSPMRFQLQGVLESVECTEDRLLQRGAPQRTRQISGPRWTRQRPPASSRCPRVSLRLACLRLASLRL